MREINSREVEEKERMIKNMDEQREEKDKEFDACSVTAKLIQVILHCCLRSQCSSSSKRFFFLKKTMHWPAVVLFYFDVLLLVWLDNEALLAILFCTILVLKEKKIFKYISNVFFFVVFFECPNGLFHLGNFMYAHCPQNN